MSQPFCSSTSARMDDAHVRDTRDASEFRYPVTEIKVFEIQEVRRIKSTRSIKRSSAKEHETAAGNLYVA